MRILHTVEFYPPSIGGMQEVVKQLSERLAKLGHDVTVATTKLPERTEKIINSVKIEEFNISGNSVRGLSGEIDTYQTFLLTETFDIVTNFAAQQWATDIMLPIIDQVKGKKVFVPTGFSGLHLKEYRPYFEALKTYLGLYDMNVFLSHNYRDIAFARSYCTRDKLLVIPNGAGTDEFLSPVEIDIRKKLGIPTADFLILLVGSHTGVKGHGEAIAIFRRARIDHATLLIVANSFGGGCTRACATSSFLYRFSPFARAWKKNIQVKQLTRKETVASFHAADLFLFPSNIECSPLVLFEAMASKTPFLTTDAGNAVEICQWSGGGKILPTHREGDSFVKADIKESARMLEEMYHSTNVRRELAEAGFQAWNDRFTWEKITLQYESLYHRLVRQANVSLEAGSKTE